MGRPRVLSDEERKASNARRQAKWRERNKGYARLKVRNDHRRRKEEREGREEEVVKKRVVLEMPRYGELRYEAEPGVDVPYEERGAVEEKRVPSEGKEVGYEGPMTEEHKKALEWLDRKKKKEVVEVEM